MLGKKNQSAVLAKYFSMYKKNPRSKVFAPLAESFRKLGMLDDAFKILKEGIRYHPTYTLGYIVLAHCYFDQGKFELTYNTLRPIIAQNADNISLQKIFAQACLNLGYLDEALDVYKYLLFMNPKDKFFGEQVKKLEDDLMVGHKRLTLDQIVKAPDMERLPPSQTLDDDWVQVNFNQGPASEATEQTQIIPEVKLDSEWVMERPGLQSHPILKEEVIQSRSLEDDFFADEFEEYDNSEDSSSAPVVHDSPIVSHTLIDLYLAQEYYDKAIELINKILELNPEDVASKKKLAQVIELQKSMQSSARSVTEEDGHDELISIIENQVKSKSPQEMKLQVVLDKFLFALKDQAQSHR